MFFSRLVELAAIYATTPEAIMADVREVLDEKTSDVELADSRQSTELIRLANAVPRHALRPVLDTLWIDRG